MSDIEHIYVVSTYAEALLLQSRLDGEEIPYHLQAFNDPAFGSFWRKTEGWGVVLAPPEYRERIVQICEDIAQARRESGE